MDNNNNNNTNNNTNNSNSLQKRVKNKFNKYKLTLPVFFGIIGFFAILIIVLSGNFEKSDSIGPYGNKFARFLILLIFIYFIMKIVLKRKIDSKKTSIFGFFKIERSLLIYLFAILLIALLL